VTQYGPPQAVHIEEIPLPIPRAGEVRVRVQATVVTAGDARIRGMDFPAGMRSIGRVMFGLRGPRHSILGSGFSGVVDAVGSGVDTFAPGEQVCGTAGAQMGAHAEYVVVPSARVVPKPASVSHDAAAAMIFGGTTALHYLRTKATVEPGMSVLVNGTSGAVGSNVVQLATYFGARVTGVASGPNLSIVRKLGADQVVDYTRSPIDTLADRFDIVVDTVGTLTPAAGRRLITPGGTVLLIAAGLGAMLSPHRNVKTGPAPERAQDVQFLLSLMVDGHLRTLTDRIVCLDEIVAAHERVDSRHKVGNVVLRPASITANSANPQA
jgi:NADPH:quinone reductase-like Zn-dependent oxidoreductase